MKKIYQKKGVLKGSLAFKQHFKFVNWWFFDVTNRLYKEAHRNVTQYVYSIHKCNVIQRMIGGYIKYIKD